MKTLSYLRRKWVMGKPGVLLLPIRSPAHSLFQRPATGQSVRSFLSPPFTIKKPSVHIMQHKKRPKLQFPLKVWAAFILTAFLNSNLRAAGVPHYLGGIGINTNGNVTVQLEGSVSNFIRGIALVRTTWRSC